MLRHVLVMGVMMHHIFVIKEIVLKIVIVYLKLEHLTKPVLVGQITKQGEVVHHVHVYQVV